MFDLGLLRKPTFTGGLIAAFGVSASVFSLLTYLVIYVQNVLGYSAVGAGVRFLFLSGAAFVAAAIAGRLTESVPAKWLIAPGFVVLGVGPAAHPRHRGRLVVDPPHPRTAGQRDRRRHDQHPARLDRGRRGHGGPLGHGLGHQLHVPAGRHRHRHRRARHDLRPPGRGRRSGPAWPARPRPTSPTGSPGRHRRPDRGRDPGRTARRTRPAGRRRHVELRGRAQPHHRHRDGAGVRRRPHAASC